MTIRQGVIDLSSLQRAIDQLRESLDYAGSELARNDAGIARQFRAAAIQAFEYTYELSHKMLKRYLETTEPSAEAVGIMNFPELVRLGAERGLLRHSWDVWRDYRHYRNLSSHTYNEDKAEDVFRALPGFLEEASFLCHAMKQRQKND